MSTNHDEIRHGTRAVEAIDAGPDQSPADTGEFAAHDDGEAGAAAFIGQSIGRYTITRVLGIGGMGTVFEAQQDRPRRPVALKIMRRGLSSPRAIKRFQYEAEILGTLHHSNIAQIYDAGMHQDPGSDQDINVWPAEHRQSSEASTEFFFTEAPGTWRDGASGVPYFAMEYIDNARPITTYADERRLSVEQRLRIFIAVCHAVHHGHQKSIVHRDLKPANILVDAVGEPKVIDFGVARLTDSDIAVTTIDVDIGQIIGTVQYMSPEQCHGDSRNVDTRSDVYSLGVVLFELLAGSLPYEPSTTSLLDATRTVCEAEPARLSSVDRRLRGDLETIVHKAMAKDPARRYQSAEALANDVLRHITGKPIEARPPSRWQKTVRWVGRHPFVTTTAASLLIAGAVLGLTFASVWYLSYTPQEIVLTSDGREARLVSVAGHTLRMWRSPVEDGIKDAVFTEVPAELGGGRLVLVVYGTNRANPYPAAVCAFDIDRGGTEPLWIGRLEREDLPERLRARAFHPDEFRSGMPSLLHVFPDHPGPQIVVSHDHHLYSQSAIRIYDLSGEVLYQAWHDGPISDMYWLSEPGLLLFAGLNGLVYWEQREIDAVDQGQPGVRQPHPRIVGAIRPRLGKRSTDWICPDLDGENIIKPAWYRCLLPPVASDTFHKLEFREAPPVDSASYASLHAPTGRSEDKYGHIDFVIDKHGNEHRDARIVGDNYIRQPGLPDPSGFRLADLPPVREDVELPGLAASVEND